MRTIHTTAELRAALALQREQGKSIGFVPTMGALHEGHRSLIRLSKQHSDVTVVSIFVNPTQFGPAEDFERYPRTLDADAGILVDEEVELLFAPTVDQMYPSGHFFKIVPGPVASRYEGAKRPGHFEGVATVVAILFNIVQPQTAYFGQKDAQQVAVINKMVRDFSFPIEIVVGPTIREKGGLALSSRNRYLDSSERKEALALSKTLFLVKDLVASGNSATMAISQGIAEFHQFAKHGTLDYLDIVGSETFEPVTAFEGVQPGERTIIIAAQIGATRLIDNLPF